MCISISVSRLVICVYECVCVCNYNKSSFTVCGQLLQKYKTVETSLLSLIVISNNYYKNIKQ